MKMSAAEDQKIRRARWFATASPEEIAAKRADDVARAKAWAAANPEKARARSAAWHEKNRGQQNARRRAHYEANKPQHGESNRAYVAANKARTVAYKAEWYEENKGRLKAAAQERREATYARRRDRLKTDAAFAILCRLRARLHKALRAQGAVRAAGTKALLGCSPEEFRAHIQAQFLPGMDWENRSEWHLDHKLPCAHFDLTDAAQQKACFHFTNIRPLWGRDNQRKSAKVLPEFLAA